MDKERIIIAGGGIGGLATAMGLAQKGFKSIVLEKASQFGEIGAGIQLGPNAFHAFDYLGVGDQARDMAVYIDSLRLMDAMSGDEITRIPLDDLFRKRFKNPYAVVHRGDLHGVFLKACRESELIELRNSSAVESYEQDGNSATAILADGTKIVGQALIGADGLWSKIRQQMLGDGAPRVSGHSTYRSVIPVEDMPEDLRWNAATLWAGPKCHIVHYPLSGWKFFNLVVTYHNDAAEPVAGKSVSHDEVRRGFQHVSPVAKQIIDRGRAFNPWRLKETTMISLRSTVNLSAFLAAGLVITGTMAAQADGVVNVYSYRQAKLIQPMLDAFTAKTGIKTNVLFAKKGLGQRIKSEGANSPADLLLTVDIGRLDAAKSLGITQAVSSDVINGNIPANFRDEEGHWFGLTLRARIVYASRERVKQQAITYEELADPKWKGKLCTRSGQHVYSIGLFASMIAALGEEKAETWLRGVKANLARKPTGNDRAQVKAIFAGECDIALDRKSVV